MQNLTKAQEEIKALEGLRSKRMNKYQEALRKQAEAKNATKQHSVHQLEEDRKKLQGSSKGLPGSKADIHHVDSSIVAGFENKHHEAQNRRNSYRSNTLSSPTPKKSTVKTSLPSDTPSPSKSSVSKKKELPPAVQKVKDEEEHAAKSNLAKLLDKTGEDSIVLTGFSSIRKRYLTAIAACRPTTIDVSNSVELEAAKQRRAARRQQALTKDRMGKIQRAWDNYEDKAQDRPSTRDAAEMLEEENVAKIEAEVNNAWISYAKQVAVEAAEEEDDDDLDYWIAEAKRLKAEAEARRLARLRALEERLRSEEDEYWIEEALRLRAKHKNKKGPISADEDDQEVNQEEEMALALQLRAKQKKVYHDGDNNDRLQSKKSKKSRAYDSDSDSDGDDKGGATVQKKQHKKKSFGNDSDNEGLAAKASKKGRAYGDGSESDSDDAGAASMQGKTRKDYGDDQDGALGAKVKRKSHGGNFSDDDSEDETTGLASLPRKQSISKKKYGSDSDSSHSGQDGDEVFSSTKGASNRRKHRKDYGGNDAGVLNTKQPKKGRSYNSDSDSDSDDRGGATIQKQLRKNHGTEDGNDRLPTKHKKKGEQHVSDSDSDEEISSKQHRKNFDQVDVGELPKKGKKKGQEKGCSYNSDSDSDSDDRGGATSQKQQRKNYGTQEGNDCLPTKKKKKGHLHGSDSDSGEEVSSKQHRKNFDQADVGELPKKGKKKGQEKGRAYNSDSDSDSDDRGGATSQKQQRKNYGTQEGNDRLPTKPKKKGHLQGSDSDSGEEVSSKQHRKNFDQADDGELPKKGNKKGQQFGDDSDSESDSADGGNTTHQTRKDYGGTNGDDKLTLKQKKKARTCNAESDSDSHSSSESETVEPEDASVCAQARRKNYGRTYSGDGLPTKQKKKKPSYLSENSDAQDENAKRPVRRRKKNFGDGDVDETLSSKQSRKNSKFGDSDSSNSSSSSAEEESSREKKEKSLGDSDSSGEEATEKKGRKNISDDSSDSDSSASDSSEDAASVDSDDDNVSASEVRHRRKSYEDDSGSGEDAEVKKVKKKREFVPTSDSDDDDRVDQAKKSVAAKRKGKKTTQTRKIGESKGSFRLPVNRDSSFHSESQQSLSSSFVVKGDNSVGALNANSSIPNSKFYKSEYFDCPSESDSSGGEPRTKQHPLKKSSSKKAIPIKEENETLDDEPKNPDGSPWKNPLKGWTNTPTKKILSKGARLIMKVPTKTECWRKTMSDKVVDSAPFHWQKITGDFRIQVKISGNFSTNFQKAGIMLRLDQENWLLSGMEFFKNRMHHSTCLTLDHTDWSLCQLPYKAEIAGVWFSIKRIGGSYECHYSYDGTKWVLTRQGSFTERPVLYVGICGVNPTSDDLRASFEYYRCQTGGYIM